MAAAIDRGPGSRWAGLDGLRGIAALAVLSAHVGSHMAPASVPAAEALVLTYGNAGLTVFFVLSGFLLFSPFVSAILTGRPLPSIRGYLTARAFRIYPAYLVVFLLAQLVLGSLNRHGIVELHPHGDLGPITEAPVLVANLLLVQSLVPGMIGTGILPAWSLTAELCFYLALPLLALAGVALAKRHARRPLAALACALCPLAVGLITCSLLAAASLGPSGKRAFLFSWGGGTTAVVERSLLAQAGLFALGMVAAWFVAWMAQSSRTIALADRRRISAWSVVVLVYGVVGEEPMAAFLGPTIGFGAFYIAWHLQAIATAALLVLMVTPRPDGRRSRLAAVLDRPLPRGLGAVSYGVYLWHMPVISWLVIQGVVFTGAFGVIGNLVVVTLIAVALACPTYLLVERPAIRLRRRLTERRRDPLVGNAAHGSGVEQPQPVEGPAS